METAAGNTAGAMTGFMGMGMMNMNTGNPFGTVTANVANTTNYATPNQQAYNAAVAPNNTNQNTSTVVGAATQPSAPQNEKWACKCGAENEGKFCISCGMSKEEATKKANVCPKCGMEYKEGSKFCGECGQKLV